MNRRSSLRLGAATASACAWPLASRGQDAVAPPAAAPASFAPALQARVRHEGMGLAGARADTSGTQFAFAGRRSARDDRPPEAASAFEWGSITKTCVGLLLADMALARELALDEPVEAALGQRLRDDKGTPLTWTDLATHRSGLPRLPANLRPRDGRDPYADYDAAALAAFLADWQPNARRDTRWEYSNLGFGVLGHALARRAGLGFDELLRGRILEPLGLQDTRLALTGRVIPQLLQGHDPRRDPVPRWQFDVMAGAGALTGPAGSLLRYGQAAAGLVETPLRAAFELAMQPRADGQGRARMGLGWILAPLRGQWVANHDGSTFGFSSSLWVDATRKRTALVLANAQVGIGDLALHLLEPTMPLRNVAQEAAATQRESVTVEPLALSVLPGTYVLNPQFAVTVRLRDGRLHAQATGQGEFELYALDARRFFARVTALEIHFEGGSGAPPAFVLHQGGQQLRFVRRAEAGRNADDSAPR